MKMNRKGQGLSINVVIIVAIGLSVLLFVGTFLSGGFKSMSEKITTFGRESTQAETSGKFVRCNTICSAWVAQGCEGSIATGDIQAACCEKGDTGYPDDCKGRVNIENKCGCS